MSYAFFCKKDLNYTKSNMPGRLLNPWDVILTALTMSPAQSRRGHGGLRLHLSGYHRDGW